MMSSKPDVLKFIERFQNEGSIKTFTEGCCYWFAFILTTRFPEESTIMYNPVYNHYAVDIWGVLYDIRGEIEYDDEWIPWDEYRKTEKLDSLRLERNCINF